MINLSFVSSDQTRNQYSNVKMMRITKIIQKVVTLMRNENKMHYNEKQEHFELVTSVLMLIIFISRTSRWLHENFTAKKVKYLQAITEGV